MKKLRCPNCGHKKHWGMWYDGHNNRRCKKCDQIHTVKEWQNKWEDLIMNPAKRIQEGKTL